MHRRPRRASRPGAPARCSAALLAVLVLAGPWLPVVEAALGGGADGPATLPLPRRSLLASGGSGSFAGDIGEGPRVSISSSSRHATTANPYPVFVVDFGQRVPALDPTSLFELTGADRADVVYDIDAGRVYVGVPIVDRESVVDLTVTARAGAIADGAGRPSTPASLTLRYAPLPPSGLTPGGGLALAATAAWGVAAAGVAGAGVAVGALSPATTTRAGGLGYSLPGLLHWAQRAALTGRLAAPGLPLSVRQFGSAFSWAVGDVACPLDALTAVRGGGGLLASTTAPPAFQPSLLRVDSSTGRLLEASRLPLGGNGTVAVAAGGGLAGSVPGLPALPTAGAASGAPAPAPAAAAAPAPAPAAPPASAPLPIARAPSPAPLAVGPEPEGAGAAAPAPAPAEGNRRRSLLQLGGLLDVLAGTKPPSSLWGGGGDGGADASSSSPAPAHGRRARHGGGFLWGQPADADSSPLSIASVPPAPAPAPAAAASANSSGPLPGRYLVVTSLGVPGLVANGISEPGALFGPAALTRARALRAAGDFPAPVSWSGGGVAGGASPRGPYTHLARVAWWTFFAGVGAAAAHALAAWWHRPGARRGPVPAWAAPPRLFGYLVLGAAPAFAAAAAELLAGDGPPALGLGGGGPARTAAVVVATLVLAACPLAVLGGAAALLAASLAGAPSPLGPASSSGRRAAFVLDPRTAGGLLKGGGLSAWSPPPPTSRWEAWVTRPLIGCPSPPGASWQDARVPGGRFVARAGALFDAAAGPAHARVGATFEGDPAAGGAPRRGWLAPLSGNALLGGASRCSPSWAARVASLAASSRPYAVLAGSARAAALGVAVGSAPAWAVGRGAPGGGGNDSGLAPPVAQAAAALGLALAYVAYLRLTPTGAGASRGGGKDGEETTRLHSFFLSLRSALATTGSPFRLRPDAAAELGCAVADVAVGGTALALALAGVKGAGALPSPGATAAAAALLLGAQLAGLALYLATRGSLAASALRSAPWPAGPPSWLARGAVLASTGAKPAGPPPGPGVPLPDQRFANAVLLASRAVVSTNGNWLARKFGARWAAKAKVGSGAGTGRPLPALVARLATGPSGNSARRGAPPDASPPSARPGSGAAAAASAAGPGPAAFLPAGLLRGGSAASSAGGGAGMKPGSGFILRTASGAPSSTGGGGGSTSGGSFADRARAWVGGWGRRNTGTTSASEPEFGEAEAPVQAPGSPAPP